MTAKRKSNKGKKIGSYKIRKQIQIAKSRGKIFDSKLRKTNTKIKQNEKIQMETTIISKPKIQSKQIYEEEEGFPIY